MKLTKSGSLSLLLLLFLASCDGLNPNKVDNDPEDTKVPVITLRNPEGIAEGGSGNMYGNDDTIHVKIDIEDNYLLKDWQIDIAYRGDIEYMKTAADPMARTWIGFLDGDEDSISFTITLDGDPWAGPYEFRITVRDSALNTTILKTYLNVSNSIEFFKPVITTTSPTSATVDTFGIGTFIAVTGTFTDNLNSLSDAFVRVRNIFTSELLEDSERWLSLPGPAYNLNESIYIPPVTPGDYQVEIYVHDSTKNLQTVFIPIYITTN